MEGGDRRYTLEESDSRTGSEEETESEMEDSSMMDDDSAEDDDNCDWGNLNSYQDDQLMLGSDSDVLSFKTKPEDSTGGKDEVHPERGYLYDFVELERYLHEEGLSGIDIE